MPPRPIEKDIHNTLAYFAYSQYPLTIFELFKWQYKPERVYGYHEIEDMVKNSSWLSKRIGHFEGMYGLGTNGEVEQQVANRKRRYLDSVRKQRKVQKVVRYVSRLPCVQGIAICNSLSFHFTREKSDIDLFIITSRGRLWSARFWAVAPLLFLRQRPGETKKDPVDMSFFLSENNLNIEHLCIGDEDPYLSFWIRNLMPVYGSAELWDKFFTENNWTHALLPNAHVPKRAYQVRCGSRFSIPFCPMPECWLRVLQLIRLPGKIKLLANSDTCVVMDDTMLKFHTTDRRAEIAEAFEKKCV
ncbi:hypothetical protein KJ673_02380 [Patescibacteria group bacterium]|nr:hypothetical protein [Patescibacteria group bacterium]MCG2687633.1 hypothetical protein [Candidatus Parcubacteria bacterium]